MICIALSIFPINIKVINIIIVIIVIITNIVRQECFIKSKNINRVKT